MCLTPWNPLALLLVLLVVVTLLEISNSTRVQFSVLGLRPSLTARAAQATPSSPTLNITWTNLGL